MKQKILLLLLGSLLSLSAMARDFEYTYEGQTLTYTVIDEVAKTCQTKEGDYNNEKAGNVVSGALIIPEKVNDGNSDYTVTSIGELAFYVCGDLTSVEIPNSVTSIGDYAFAGCGGLTSVVIPNSVTSMGESTFWNCSSLTSVIIPSSVTTIGAGAFEGCTSLTSAVIPNSVTSIGREAFYGCFGLTSVVIGNSVTFIDNQAFDACFGLIKAAYPNNLRIPFGKGVTTVRYNPKGAIIEDGFIYGPEKTSILFAPLSLEGEYVIPNSVTSIDNSAFAHCSSLTSVIIPNSVTSIGIYPFSGCSGLIKSAYPNNLKNPFEDGYAVGYNPEGAIIEDGFIYGPDKTSIRFAPFSLNGEYVIPNSVTSIGKSAFYRCNSLTSVIIPNSVTSIGEYAFYECSGLVKSAYPNNLKNPFPNNKRLAYRIGYNPEGAIIEDGFIYGPDKSSIIFAPLSLNGEYVVQNSVTEIGGYAFSLCSDLTSVVIGNAVTSIGSFAFSNCSGLTSVVIPNSVTSISESAFSNCSGLTSVEIPNSVTSIGDAAFYRCSGLTSVIIPNSVTSIGEYAFSGCSGLTSVIIPNSVTSIGGSAFSNCGGLTSVEIGNSVASIGEKAFSGCSALTSVVIPNSATSIGGSAFSGCGGLTSVEIPNSVISIGGSVFSGCSGLKSVVIGNSVTSIGEKAFSGCSGLTSVVIPNSVTSIDSEAFSSCSGLTSVVIGNSVTSIGDNAFDGCSGLIKSAYPNNLKNPFGKAYDVGYNPEGAIIEDGFIYGPEKTSILFAPLSLEGEYVIPNSVTSIDYRAFAYCSSLTSVIIPNSVISIGSYVFSYCSGLVKSAYPNNLTNPFGDGYAVGYNPIGAIIEDGFIYGPEKTSIRFAPFSLKDEYVIPNTVTSIGNSAFIGCSGLTSVNVLAEKPASMMDDSFEGLYDEVTLSVPDAAVNAYLSTNWSFFKNIRNNDAEEDDAEIKTFTDGVLEYRINPADETATVIGAKDNSNLQIPERFTDDSDSSNPVRYYVKAIGYKAFDGKDVKSIEFNTRSQIEYIGDYAFANTSISSVSLPSTVKSIGNSAFNKTSKLNKVVLNSGLETVGEYAFAESAMSILELESDVKSIGEGAFYNTYNLKSISTLNSEYIGAKAFATSKPREQKVSIYIGSNVKAIGKDAFENFYASEVRTDNLSDWCGIEFGNAAANPLRLCGKLNVDGTELTQLQIPLGIEKIKPYAFAGFSKMESLDITDDVKILGDYCFGDCNGLNQIRIGKGIDQIPGNIFTNSNNVRSVVICDALKPIEISRESTLLRSVTDLYMGRKIELIQ